MSRVYPVLGLLVALTGCGLTVTNERPTYEQLDPWEKSAVDTMIAELKALDAQVRPRSKALFGKEIDLEPVLDRERINVAYEGLIFTYNMGDGLIHMAVWENLTDQQRDLIAGWFDQSPATSKAWYEKFFYRLMAVSHGVKQFMFNAHTAAWVFGNRTLFSIERDSMRTALAHFDAVGRRAGIWTFASNACAPLLQQQASTYGHLFTAAEAKAKYHNAKAYLRDNFKTLANPEDPTGYMYFVCQWVKLGINEAEALNGELRWLYELPLL